MGIVNLKLMSHPLNYLTIAVMALLLGVAGHLLLSLLGIDPATKKEQEQKTSAWGSMPAGQAPGQIRAGAIDPQFAPLSTNAVMM